MSESVGKVAKKLLENGYELKDEIRLEGFKKFLIFRRRKKVKLNDKIAIAEFNVNYGPIESATFATKDKENNLMQLKYILADDGRWKLKYVHKPSGYAFFYEDLKKLEGALEIPI